MGGGVSRAPHLPAGSGPFGDRSVSPHPPAICAPSRPRLYATMQGAWGIGVLGIVTQRGPRSPKPRSCRVTTGPSAAPATSPLPGWTRIEDPGRPRSEHLQLPQPPLHHREAEPAPRGRRAQPRLEGGNEGPVAAWKSGCPHSPAPSPPALHLHCLTTPPNMPRTCL